MKYNRQLFLIIALVAMFYQLSAQSNFRFSEPNMLPILKGQYNPSQYYSGQPNSNKAAIKQTLLSQTSSDSLLHFLFGLNQFRNRNSGSDTLSLTNGIGAARNWALTQFDKIKFTNPAFVTGFFQFDQAICNMNSHKNVLGILPGTDTAQKGFILIEAHYDSRCENVCDTACEARGMEDNGSGVALVLELARVLSKHTYERTLVFMLTTAEEQGLDGANAFAVFAKTNALPIRAVLNNDVIGGIICGKTASPPGCPGENEIDSLQVRIFSAGTNYSMPKGLARYTKLSFEEELLAQMPVKTNIQIMNAEDRIGRGGDHIPFRQQGYSAIRLTSANEHGDANATAPGYLDRQHSTRDVLGKDVNGDGKLDSLFVSTSYLKRNVQINGITATMLAIGPQAPPEFELINDGNGLSVKISNPVANQAYKIGFRSRANTFDTLFTLVNQSDLKTYHVKKDSFYFVSIATMDAAGTESLFSAEKYVKVAGVPPTGIMEKDLIKSNMQLLPISPNPIDETLTLSVWMLNPRQGLTGNIVITDLQGRIVQELEIPLDKNINEVVYAHGFSAKGLYHCSFYIAGEKIDTQRIWFK
jgi:hypothetical protein